MNEIILNAPAKINWCLDIVGKREDGYHLLDMLMQPVSLCDTLIIRESDTLTLHLEGSPLPAGEENLVMKAARKLQPFSGGQGTEITLIKRIPSSAGLGGGSADAACAMKGLRSLWNLPLSDAQLSETGLSLGADIPFCLYGAPARVQGIGETIIPVPLGSPASLLIVKPAGSLSTPAVFSTFDERTSSAASDIDAAASAIREGNYSALRHLLSNALFPPALRLMPELNGLISSLYDAGAQFAAMSGSGSACFGVFNEKASASRARSALENKLRNTVLFEARTLPEG